MESNKTKDWEIKIVKKKGRVNIKNFMINPEAENSVFEYNNIFDFNEEGWYFVYQFVELNDDSNWFFSSIKSDYTIQQGFYFLTPLKEGPYKGYLDAFTFTFSQKIKSQTRTFKKVPQVLAEIGGIFSSIIIIGNFLVGKLNKTEFEIDVINNLFYLNEKNKLNDKNGIVEKCKIEKNKNNRNNSFKYYDNNGNANEFHESNIIEIRKIPVVSDLNQSRSNQNIEKRLEIDNNNYSGNNMQIIYDNSQMQIIHDKNDINNTNHIFKSKYVSNTFF